MTAENIIEGLNNYIENIRNCQTVQSSGHIVLRREIQINSTFKAYKTYKYTLYFINNSKAYTICTIEKTAKVLEGQEDKMNKDMGILLVQQLLDIANSDYFKQVIEGTYALNRV